MLIIARHGRTDANRAGLLLGRSDVGLDEVGRTQAEAVAAAVARDVGTVDRVVASPLTRTHETASAFGVEVETDDRWIELDYGGWDTTPVRDVAAADWEVWRSDPDFRPPGGESLTELDRRVREALDDLAADAVTSTIVVVTHVSPIKSALGWTLGLDAGVHWRSFVAPASLTRIAVTDRGPSLHCFNDTSHLR